MPHRETLTSEPSLPTPDLQRQERIDYTESARCISCGYLLRGLPEPRCPECGRGFNPNDPTTMKIPGLRQRRARTFGGEMIKAAVAAALLSLAARHNGTGCFLPVALPLHSIGVPEGVWYEIAMACLLLGPLMWLAIGVAWVRRRLRGNQALAGRVRLEDGPAWLPTALLLLVLTCLISLRFDRCYHAATVGIGPLGLSYSTVGGPCRNGPCADSVRLSEHWYLTRFEPR